jgi:hypothetical protein
VGEPRAHYLLEECASRKVNFQFSRKSIKRAEWKNQGKQAFPPKHEKIFVLMSKIHDLVDYKPAPYSGDHG